MTAFISAPGVEEALRGLDVGEVYLGVTDPSSGLLIAAYGSVVAPPVELSARGLCWGHLAVSRELNRVEQVALRRARATLASVLMRRLLRVPVVSSERIGVLNLDPEGVVTGINDHGMDMLPHLAAQCCPDDPLLPLAFRSLLRSGRSAMLLPDENLGWLRVHSTVQHGVRRTVTMSVQAARPLQVAPILLAARGATPRAVEVALRVLRGMTSAEIAEELRISPHTVQDHLKPVFSALAVNSRRQLISSLFPSLKPYDLC